MIRDWARQAGSDVRFDWGPMGVEAVAAEVVVIVDVLRFTTAVEAAVSAGAAVFPCRWKDTSASAFAHAVGAILADDSDGSGSALSPMRLAGLRPGDRVVLPSPNGSTCAAIAVEHDATVVAACLRNISAVAEWVNGHGGSVAVVACGERWPDGSLRPSLEDQLGAAAVLAALTGSRSPEAEAMTAWWAAVHGDVARLVRECASGREIIERRWGADLDYACQLDVSATVPVLTDGAFTTTRPPRHVPSP